MTTRRHKFKRGLGQTKAFIVNARIFLLLDIVSAAAVTTRAAITAAKACSGKGRFRLAAAAGCFTMKDRGGQGFRLFVRKTTTLYGLGRAPDTWLTALVHGLFASRFGGSVATGIRHQA